MWICENAMTLQDVVSQSVVETKRKEEKKSNQKKIERKEKVIVEYKYSPITKEEEKEKNIYQEKQE